MRWTGSADDNHLQPRRDHDPSHRRAGEPVSAGARFPAGSHAGAARGEPRLAGAARARPGTGQPHPVLPDPTSCARRDHTMLVDSCIGNDKDRPTRPKWHMKRDDTFMRGPRRAGLSVDGHRRRHVHPPARGPRRLEHAAGERALGADVPEGALPVLRHRARALAAQNAKAAVPPIADSVLPIVAAKRAEMVQSDHALGDYVRLLPTPGHTPDHFAVLVGRTGEDGRDHRRFDPLAAAGALSRAVDAVRLRPRASRPGPAAPSWRRFCDTGTLCCTAHFPSPSAGRIEALGRGLSLRPRRSVTYGMIPKSGNRFSEKIMLKQRGRAG